MVLTVDGQPTNVSLKSAEFFRAHDPITAETALKKLKPRELTVDTLHDES